MANTNIDILKVLATNFRAAILKCNPHSLIGTLKKFPNGSCGDACLLLAKHLSDNGCGKFEYVLGSRKQHNHAWLLKDGVVVDITADQFEDHQEAVVVTHDLGWYNTFKVEDRYVADYERYRIPSPDIYAKLDNSYKTICDQLK